MKQLQEPFPPEDIEWRVGSTNSDKTKGIALAYVTNRAIMNRLDEIFGPFGWKNEFREWKGTSQLCGISILWNEEWITKWDGADDSQTEAVKGGLSDAMKRAGYQWGIGRYLYKLENQWVPIEQAGRSYKLKQEPRLPSWALPEGYVYQTQHNAPAAPTPPPVAPSAPAQTNTPAAQHNRSSASTGPQGLISEAQMKYCYRMKNEKRIDEDDFRRMISEIGGRESIKELTKKEASEFINLLNNYQKGA